MWYYMYPDTTITKRLPYYLESIGLHELQPAIRKDEGDECDQFFYGSKGTGILEVYGEKNIVHENNGFFIPAKCPHHYYPLGEVWDIRWMVPGGLGLPELYRQCGLDRAKVFELNDITPLDIILTKMRSEIIHNKEKGCLLASSYTTEFITEFARQSGLFKTASQNAAATDTTYSKHMELIKDYIEYHFMNKITLNELGSLIGVTPQHLCKIFKNCTGMRPTSYITSVRIEKACTLLSKSDYSITNISYMCGFDNPNYFWKLFRSLKGVTPGEYRENLL